MKTIEEIELTKFIVRVSEGQSDKEPRQLAELVAFDKEGNEYRTLSQVYVQGEFLEVRTDIVRTDKPELTTNS